MKAADNNKSPGNKPVDAIILAAGEGTRMGNTDDAGQPCDGPKPKVAYEVAGQPMIRWVVHACMQANVRRCVVVVGFEGNQVREALADMNNCVFVEQNERLGTGHATRMAEPYFSDHSDDADVFVLAGDGPLIRPQTLTTLLNTHRANHAAATLATAIIDDPSGYGRVIRDANHHFDRIVEQKDATADELAVREINPSYYCFDARKLFDGLARINNNNAQQEYYLTDVPGLLKRDGDTVTVVDAVPAQDVLSINTTAQLREVDRLLRARIDHPSRQEVATAPARRPA